MGAPTAQATKSHAVTIPNGLAGRWASQAMLPAVLAVLAGGVFWLVHASIIDDSYITISYARNVAFHAHWGLIPQRTSNTATSPLNVLLLAALTAVLRHPAWALAALFIAANVVLGLALRRVARTLALPDRAAWIGWALVAANPLLLSTVGLEVTLTAAILALLLATAVRADPWLFGLCAGLAVLTRIDLVIVAIVLFTAGGLWRAWWKPVIAAAAITLPWFTFSWVVLGSAVPDTLIIKTQQKSWGGYSFGNGPLLYLRTYPAATVLGFLPAVVGVLALVVWSVTRLRRRSGSPLALPAALAVAGVAHFVAYSLLGVPPYHWYYGPSLICLSIFFALTVAAAPRAHRALVGLASLVLAAQAGFDLHHGFPWKQAAVTTNWATPAQYATLGTELPHAAGNQPVHAGGEIGAIAYFCDCAIVDEFSDRAELIPTIDAVIAQSGPLPRFLLTLNYHFLDRTTPPLSTRYTLAHTDHAPPGERAWPASTSWHGPDAPQTDGYFTLTPNR